MSHKDLREHVARCWLQNAGLYIEDPEQVLDELFSPGGLLYAWAADTKFQTHILSIWFELRPQGEAAELDSLAYQQAVFRPTRELMLRAGGRGASSEADRASAAESGSDRT